MQTYTDNVDSIVKKCSLKKFKSFDQIEQHIDSQFNEDSYNSLTIEGYAVTPELISKIEAGDIRLTQDSNKLAALGYKPSI